MIRFRCIYCGQIIKASEAALGKQGKCPQCGHVVRVLRPQKKITLQKSLDEMEKLAVQKLSATAEGTAAKNQTVGADSEFIRKAFRIGRIKRLFIPTYNELSLFIMSTALLLTLISSSKLRRQFFDIIFSEGNFYIYPLTVIFVVGMGLSFYHVFTRRNKSSIEKWAMLIFAVAANAMSAFLAGGYMITHPESYTLIIFPIWNMINAVLLVALLRAGVINEENITDEEATAGQVIICTIITLIVFSFSHFVFKLYWAITYSICVVYATAFSKAVQETLCPSVREMTEMEG